MQAFQPIQIDAGNNSQAVNPEEAAIRDKKAFYELLTRSGWYLPKLSSKFINQKVLQMIREKQIFAPMQQQVVFRICSTPPKKETLVDRYIELCVANNLVHGIDYKKQNFPDKDYLILAISTFTNGADPIFDRNYYPLDKKIRSNAPAPFTLENKDGFLTNIPQHLHGQKGGRSVKMNVLSKESKMELKMLRAEKLIKEQQEKRANIEKQIQAQKITKALFSPDKVFDHDVEREKIKVEMQDEFQKSAQLFMQQKEAEIQAEFNRQMALVQLSDASQHVSMQDNSQHSSKQATKNARATGSRMAPFPNTIQNLEDLGEGTFDNLM